MRRLAALLCLVLAGAVVALGVHARDGSASGNFNVDAIFPNAGFLIPGQIVKIAGAQVGKVTAVSLTPDNKARISMSVQSQFSPFKADASCTIQPQSLIGEKFIDCNPGTADAKALQAQDGHPATVPLARNHAPVDLDLVLDTFDLPATQRLSLLLNQLGAGLTGNGENLNEAIRRASPAIGQTKQLLDEANSDRANLQQLLTQADGVLDTLAHRRNQVANFITDAADATQVTADRAQQLQATIRGLPPLLVQARPALSDLTALAQDGLPAVRDLRAATPAATRLVQSVAPFVSRSLPTIKALGKAADRGNRTVPVVLPQLRRLARVVAQVRPVASQTAALLASVRDKGAVEGVLRFVYWATAAQARFDKTSHILPAFPIVAGACNVYATTTVQGCSANFAGGGRTRSAQRKTTHATTSTPKAATPLAPDAPAATPSAPASSPAAPSTPAPQGNIPAEVSQVVQSVLTAAGQKPGGDDSSKGLLNYLLGGGK